MTQNTARKLINKTIIQEKFNCFKVYSNNDYYSFFHIEIEDKPCFYNKLFDFFFCEERLLKSAEANANIKFIPTKKNYATLFKHLKIYLDDFNLEKNLDFFDDELKKILNSEYVLEKKGKDKLVVRLDKIGKIGEYLFTCLLCEYFKFDCIIPKVHLTTDNNMSVYGIDTLFYSNIDNIILFGESKLSIDINNGISLIKRSLSEYEKQIAEEYDLILSNRLLKDKLNIFNDLYGDASEISINIKDFIKNAKIKQIGVPIFIAHGKEIDVNEIFKNFKKVSKQKILGLDTKYFFISLPILSKSKLIASFTKRIYEMRDYYENEITK